MKMIIPDLYKPIQNFGIFFFAIGALGLVFLSIDKSNGFEYWFLLSFAGPISLLHLFIGIGLILKNRTSFFFFEAYLKLLYFGFPIGTFIAKKTLIYIKKYNIENFLK